MIIVIILQAHKCTAVVQFCESTQNASFMILLLDLKLYHVIITCITYYLTLVTLYWKRIIAKHLAICCYCLNYNVPASHLQDRQATIICWQVWTKSNIKFLSQVENCVTITEHVKIYVEELQNNNLVS